MGKDKIALAICFCLIVALTGFSGWLYLGAKGLEGKVSDLETKTSNLEAQSAELSTKVQNLTRMLGWVEFGQEQLIIANVVWSSDNSYVNCTVKNSGTLTLTVVAVQINDVNATMIPSSVTLNVDAQTTITVSKAGGFTSGMLYQFAFISARDARFLYTSLAP
jgi:hypothetical protein